ncbi:MAG: anthranilate synthase component I [Magnetococcales bacterium]|nr:anthranilate synthase component I [Magnetococcales bacterium]
MIQPSFSEFHRLTSHGNIIPLYRDILADLDTPVSAFLKVAGDQPYAFLLESVLGGEKWGRYSLIGIDPFAIVEMRGAHVTIRQHGHDAEVTDGPAPLAVLRAFMKRFQPVEVADLPRFHSGAVGYFGYDVVRYFEKLPDDNPDVLELPDALFLFPETVLIFDNLLGKLKVVTNVLVEPDQDRAACEQLYQQAGRRIETAIAALRQSIPTVAVAHTVATAATETMETVTAEMSRQQFEQAVLRAKEYIAAGDIMQVVLAQRLSLPFPYPAIELYRALRTINPSPYLFLLRLGHFSLVGSSPEILVRQQGESISVRPIAGTRPRGSNDADDQALEQELLADPKERAEHIMLVDLGRNDLGRVARTGSVQVTEQFVIERYSHVMHIVSHVTARLRPGLDAFDLIAATFPAGTVSGAPKIRAMEIIDELEVSRRGPYAGAVGYLSFSGQMDMAITIRTAVLCNQQLFVQAGAGIVADSQPDKEYEETMNKARAILRAVDAVRRGLD